MGQVSAFEQVRVITRAGKRGTVFGVEYYDRSEKRRRTYNQEWTRRDALAEAARLEGVIANGINPADESEYTLAHLFEDWRRNHLEPSCADKTRVSYESEWKIRIEPTLGHWPVAKLGKNGVRHMVRQCKDAGHGNASVNAALATLSAMMSYAVDAGHRESNPVFGVKRQPKQRRTAISWSVEDVETVAAQVKDERVRLMVLFAYYTGMRSGEIRARVWGDVGEEWIRVNTAVCPSTRVIKTTKGGDERMVPILPQARKVLDELLLLGDSQISPNGLLFPNQRGNAMCHSNLLGNHFNPARARAGKTDPRLGAMRFHELRHSWVSLMLSTGMPPANVAAWSGHTIDVMLRSYAHAIPMQVSVAELGKAFV